MQLLALSLTVYGHRLSYAFNAISLDCAAAMRVMLMLLTLTGGGQVGLLDNAQEFVPVRATVFSHAMLLSDAAVSIQEPSPLKATPSPYGDGKRQHDSQA